MKPTAEFVRHYALEAPRIDARYFQPAWRIKTPIGRLLRDNAITEREYQAACRFRDSNERAFGGLLRSAPLVRVRGNNAGFRNEGPEGLDDIEKLNAIAVAMGEFFYWLLDAVIVQEVSWTSLAAQRRIDTRTVRGWAIDAIKALAELIS